MIPSSVNYKIYSKSKQNLKPFGVSSSLAAGFVETSLGMY